MAAKIYYSDKRGVTVAGAYLRTRHKDQALAPITSVRIGREAFHLAIVGGIGLALFAWAFADLLFIGEQLGLAALALVMLLAGYALATLEMGTHLHERRMLVGDYWSVRRIRDAVMAARHDLRDGHQDVIHGALPHDWETESHDS